MIAGGRHSAPDKEGSVILSSMQKKALFASLLGVSAGALAAGTAMVAPKHVVAAPPAAAQSVFPPTPQPPAPPSPPAYFVDPAVSATLAEWNSLRQSDNYPFSS